MSTEPTPTHDVSTEPPSGGAPGHQRRAALRRRWIAVLVGVTEASHPGPPSRGWPGTRRGEAAQSTVEYALVLLGAAAVALALVAWVTRSDAISRLFDAVVGRILSQA